MALRLLNYVYLGVIVNLLILLSFTIVNFTFDYLDSPKIVHCWDDFFPSSLHIDVPK